MGLIISNFLFANVKCTHLKIGTFIEYSKIERDYQNFVYQRLWKESITKFPRKYKNILSIIFNFQKI